MPYSVFDDPETRVRLVKESHVLCDDMGLIREGLRVPAGSHHEYERAAQRGARRSHG